MTTMVSTFDRSARVVASETPARVARFPLAQEHKPATTPSAATENTSSEWREASTGEFFMNASIKRAAIHRANDGVNRYSATALRRCGDFSYTADKSCG